MDKACWNCWYEHVKTGKSDHCNYLYCKNHSNWKPKGIPLNVLKPEKEKDVVQCKKCEEYLDELGKKQDVIDYLLDKVRRMKEILM